MNYRIGKKTGLVILTTKDSKEVCTCRSVDITAKICRLLNKEEQVNVILDSVSESFTEKQMHDAYYKGYEDGASTENQMH